MQLTALRPSADLFCAYLRDGLKHQLQQGQMKAMRGFVKTCYSEELLSSTGGDSEKADSSFVIDDASSETPKAEQTFHGGLGLKFKFPGDPKK